jgi:NADH dehydrogenase FAD-containing subunit
VTLAFAKKAENFLAKVGVAVTKNARVKTVAPHNVGTYDAAAKATITVDDGKTLGADIWEKVF